MNKRLRKKLRVGEFQEMGFELRFQLPADYDESAQKRFFDSFIDQAIEANALAYGGACKRQWGGFVASIRRGSDMEQHRRSVRQWLDDHRDVSAIVVGSLEDAWR